MNNTFGLYVLGDPIIDVYHYGYMREGHPNRFYIDDEQHEWHDGAAGNVLSNLEHLVRSQKTEDIKYTRLFDKQRRMLKLERFVQEADPNDPSSKPQVILEHCSYDNHKTDYYAHVPVYEDLITGSRRGLIISDYNKGYCNNSKNALRLEKKGQFDFVIIDSRYGTVHPYFINLGRMKILHCTARESEKHDFTKYGYVFHTQHSGDVHLYRGSEYIGHLPVPIDTDVIDTSGAGDTFTASIAFYLATHRNQAWDLGLMIKAGQFAIQMCQRTIQVMGPGADELSSLPADYLQRFDEESE